MFIFVVKILKLFMVSSCCRIICEDDFSMLSVSTLTKQKQLIMSRLKNSFYNALFQNLFLSYDFLNH